MLKNKNLLLVTWVEPIRWAKNVIEIEEELAHNRSNTLGLWATPERSDGEDILGLFKNVAHKLDIKTAVESRELVPSRCIRAKSNVALYTVRITRIKYNSQDLESKLFVLEKNNPLADIYCCNWSKWCWKNPIWKRY